MKKNKKIAISCCLIVLNEEKHIKNVIDNVKSYVDEIVIIDGGSKDDTVKIAKGLGAKVFIRKWRDNFGDQRNYAIKKAKGDWILTIDADEEYSLNFLNNIRKLIRSKKYDGYAVRRREYINGKLIKYYSKGDTKPKINLFRRYAKYVSEVHETPKGLKNIKDVTGRQNYLKHLKTAEEQRKHLRYQEAIIKKLIKKYSALGDILKVIRYKKSLARYPCYWKDVELSKQK